MQNPWHHSKGILILKLTKEHLRRSNSTQRLTSSSSFINGNFKFFECRDRKKHKQIQRDSKEIPRLGGKAPCIGKKYKHVRIFHENETQKTRSWKRCGVLASTYDIMTQLAGYIGNAFLLSVLPLFSTLCEGLASSINSLQVRPTTIEVLTPYKATSQDQIPDSKGSQLQETKSQLQKALNFKRRNPSFKRPLYRDYATEKFHRITLFSYPNMLESMVSFQGSTSHHSGAKALIQALLTLLQMTLLWRIPCWGFL